MLRSWFKTSCAAQLVSNHAEVRNVKMCEVKICKYLFWEALRLEPFPGPGGLQLKHLAASSTISSIAFSQIASIPQQTANGEMPAERMSIKKFCGSRASVDIQIVGLG